MQLMELAPVKFLLVDDLEPNLVALEALLQRPGLELLKASSGAEALELLLVHDVALAIIDVQMPELDGFGLAELIRGTERTRHVPIIFLTAGARDERRRFRGYEAGAVDFLFKPVEPEVLRGKAEIFFELYRQRQKIARQRDELHSMLEEKAQLLQESRQAAEALRQSESFTRHVLNNLFCFVGVLALDGTLLEANAAPLVAAGLTIDEVRGRKFWDCYWWSHCPAVQSELREHCQRAAIGESTRYDVEIRMAGDTRMMIDFQIAPLRDEHGRITHLIPSAVDINERKQAEETLRRREAEVRSITDNLPDIVTRFDRQLRHVFANRAVSGATGLSADGFLGKTNRELGMPEHLCEYWDEHTLEVFNSGRPQVLPFSCDSPRGMRHYEAKLIPEFGPDGVTVQTVLGLAHDMTDRIEAERRLRDSEARFRALADNIPQLAWMADQHGTALWYNERWRKFTGMGAAEQPETYWPTVIHPDDVHRVRLRFEESVRGGLEWEDTFRLRQHDGQYRWFLSRAFPIRDGQGQITRWFGTNTDVTEQRQAQASLEDADRRKDEFIATLAHELRNPLAPIRSALEVLKHHSTGNAEVAELHELVTRQVQQLARLVDDLLEVSRITRGKFELRKELVPLPRIVEHALEATRPMIDEAGHELSVELPREAPWLMADPTRMAQVLTNLLNNAAKYTPRQGKIALRAEVQDQQAVISVSDSGIGIPTEHLSRVFEMFSQVTPALERSQGGLGIGLALVHGLVDMHGGKVEAHSDGSGRGSRFVVRLPVAGVQPPQPTDPPVRLEPHWNSGQQGVRVLVVDDNRDAAKTLALLLRIMGHETHTAFDGPQALELAESWGPRVILLDIGLPGMNGYEVATRIRQQDWGQGILLVAQTGWGQEDDKRRSREAGFDHHFTKPVDPAELKRLLSSLADSINGVGTR
jgi:PAS domain S-box-containing protein